MFRLRNPFVFNAETAPPPRVEVQPHPDILALRNGMKLPSRFKVEVSSPPEMEKDKKQCWLFEYGEGMYQMPNHGILENAEYVQPALTKASFVLWNKLQGRHTFPIALKTRGVQRAPIFGQLYRVPKKDIPSIDNHRWNGVYFGRKEAQVMLPWNKTITVHGDGVQPQTFSSRAYRPFNVWMYVGNPLTWMPKIRWDHEFWKRGGNCFKQAELTQNWELNKKVYVFDTDDVCKRNWPLNDLRFFRTRSAREQEKIWEIDNAEQDLYESDAKQTDREETLPAVPWRR